MVFITLPECPCCTYPSTGDHQVGEGGGGGDFQRLQTFASTNSRIFAK